MQETMNMYKMGQCAYAVKNTIKTGQKAVVIRTLGTIARNTNGAKFKPVYFREKTLSNEVCNEHCFISHGTNFIDPFWGEFNNFKEYLKCLVSKLDTDSVTNDNELVVIEGQWLDGDYLSKGMTKFYNNGVMCFAFAVDPCDPENMTTL